MAKGYLYIIASAVIFGCMPLGAKYIYADGVNSMTLVLLRSCLALPLMALLIRTRGESLAVSPKEELRISLLSIIGTCMTPVLLFSSYHHISSGMATTLHFIYPAAVVLGCVLFLGEKPRRGPILCVVLCSVGVCLFQEGGERMNPTGTLLALASGISNAAYMILLDRSGLGHISGLKLCFHMCAAGSLGLLAMCIATGSLALPGSLFGWAACVAFSIAVSMGAVLFFQKGLFLVGSQRSAILSTFEPITSLVIGVLIFREAVTLHTLLGAALILMATVLIALLDRKKEEM